MRKEFINLFTAALVFAWGIEAALAQNSNTSFEKKANAVSQAAKKSGMMDVALRDISAETGVPQDQVQAMHTNHPNANAAWLLLASVMADQTKQPAEKFLQSRLKCKTWESIAAENHVPLQTLDQRLDTLQQALTNPQQTATTSPTGTGTQPGTNATTGTGSIEQKVATLNQAVQSTGNTNAAIHAISVETGVPQDQVQTMANSHPKAGAGGVLIASVLADETKKPPESFLQTHDSGKNWETIASDNHVSLDKLDLRLNHVQSSVGSASSALTPTGR